MSHPEMDEMLLVSKYFPGVLSSKGSLARAQEELNRTYEQASPTTVPLIMPSKEEERSTIDMLVAHRQKGTRA